MTTPTDTALLERTWLTGRSLVGFIIEIDHKVVGLRFIGTALVFFLLAGSLALTMRLQLAVPNNSILGPDLYNQFFTTHGTAMMFLFAVPIMQGMGYYLVPLMVGTREIAFPRLGNFAYWLYVFGGALLFISLLFNVGPDVGWFAYVPLSGPEYTPTKRADIWAQMITFTEVAAIALAVQIITTVMKQRAPGMSLNRIPLFVWSVLATSFMVLFAMPAVMVASSALISDRLVGTHFFDPTVGGDALLWQHLFWFFGHPEVYIIFIPALGFVSSIVETFSRRPVFGYTAMVLSLIGTAFMGFGLWVHHMFATGLPQLGASFFTAASMMIAIPSGIQIFCWIATLWRGRVHFEPPLLFVLGFIVTFTMGGLTGVMLASVPLDTQVHDTFFVVAHLHYVLIGGAVFPLFGTFYYWFPKASGRMLDRTAGVWNFWLLFIGFHLTFFPMHLLGLRGMPRRVYTYLEGLGWDGLNLVASIGAFIIAVSVVVFLANVMASLRRGVPAGDNPWGAGSLEWATSSPPPPWNFTDLPVVAGREPFWVEPRQQRVVTGLRNDMREVLVTGVLDAAPNYKAVWPSPTIWTFFAAVVTTALFIGSIFTPWAIPLAALPFAITLIGWFWPRGAPEGTEAAEAEQI